MVSGSLSCVAQGYFNWAEEPRRWVLDLAHDAGVTYATADRTRDLYPSPTAALSIPLC